MPARHRDRQDTFSTLVGAGIVVAAVLAVLLPVLLAPADRPLTAPRGPDPTLLTDAPAPPAFPAPTIAAPGPAGRILPAPRSTTATPAPTSTTPVPTAPRTVEPPVTSPSPRPPAPPTPPPAAGTVMAAAWNSGLCLGAGSPAAESGAEVTQQACRSPLALRLRLVPGPGDSIALTDADSGLCVDVSGVETGEGVPVLLWTCNGGSNQHFTARPVAGSGGRTQLIAAHSGKCLDVLDRSTEPGASVQQFTCHPADAEQELRNQSFTVRPTPGSGR